MVASGALSSVSALDVEPGGEHFGRDPVAVPVGRVDDATGRAEIDRDPVGQREPVRLAAVVDDPDDLARDALGAEVVVEREVERDRVRTVLREREVLVLLGADLDVVGLELHTFAVDVERVGTLLVEGAAHLAAVDDFEQRLHAVRELAEARAEGAEVRHDAVRQESFERLDDLELLDVQLVLHLAARRRRAVARPRSAARSRGAGVGVRRAWRRRACRAAE